MSQKEMQPTPKAAVGLAINKLKQGNAAPILVEADKNFLSFAETIFPGESRAEISVKKENRASEGKGPHFDVYSASRLLDEEFPFVAVYNIAGGAMIRAAVVSQKLQEYYDATYEKTNQVAYEARRDIARLTFRQPGAKVFNGKLHPGTGLVIPQLVSGYHLAHDITPVDPANPGSYIKLVKTKNSEKAKALHGESGYQNLEEFIESQLAESSPETVSKTPHVVPLTRPSGHDSGNGLID